MAINFICEYNHHYQAGLEHGILIGRLEGSTNATYEVIEAMLRYHYCKDQICKVLNISEKNFYYVKELLKVNHIWDEEEKTEEKNLSPSHSQEGENQ